MVLRKGQNIINEGIAFQSFLGDGGEFDGRFQTFLGELWGSCATELFACCEESYTISVVFLTGGQARSARHKMHHGWV